jgi:large subunit ribosomal protein L15
MPLQRRLPKRGFKNPFHKEYAILNIKDIDRFGLDTVTPEALLDGGLIKSVKDGIKVLGTGELGRAVNVKAHAFSASALKKIQAAGGAAEVI